MARVPSLLATAAVLAATPALARERAAPVDVPAVRLDEAVRVLGSQTGASIGFRDPALAGLRGRAVRGRYTAAQALELMLRDSGARMQKVAQATYLVIRAPPPRVAGPAPPRPQPRPAPPPEATGPDIVVMASKRDIPLGAYAGSVHIISGNDLSRGDGARGSGAIEARVASVASTHLGPGRNKLFIRGIADSSFVGPTQATVGQYWGNSRITYSAPDPSLRLHDIQSVEVLEGPQGTLYGAGSLGGVVRVVPRAPDLEAIGGAVWGGVQAVEHGQPGMDGGAILNLPIVEDRLAFRAVGFGSIEGGYIDDTGRRLKDVNDVKSFGGRAALRFTPGDGWTFDVNAVGQRIEGDDSQYAERGGDGLSRSGSIDQPYRNTFWLVDLVARKQWGDLELTTSFGYARQHVFEQFEGVAVSAGGELLPMDGAEKTRNDFVVTDGGQTVLSPTAGAPEAGITQNNRNRMITAETRLARRGPDGTGWLIGVSLMENAAHVRRNFLEPYVATLLTGVSNRVREATIYGEASFAPLPRVLVTVGGRLTHSRLSGDSQDVDPAGAFLNDPAASKARSRTWLLPSASLAWRPDDTVTLFARYQQGFRPGGIAVRRDFIERFKGDRVGTAEAGVRVAGEKLDLTASASWTRWTDIQADLIDGFGFPTTTNVGNGRILSVGATGRWRPLRGLELEAAAYYNHSKVTERYSILPVELASGTVSQPGDALRDFNRLPNIADVTARAAFTYAAPLTDRLDFAVSGFARYVGQSTLGIGPILGQKQGDYLDTGLELRAGDGRRGLSLSLSNLLDSKGNRFALGSPFLIRDRNQITPLQPRTIRLGFDLAF
jgi:outer membrane receptor protein involved in Fe transport